MSTYNWDISQSGNIRLTGKMVPAGVDPYPLLSAGSLSWDGVEVDDTTLYTTDDLLDYIKGGNSAIIGRIDELELSNAGYEIRCDKSVCYVGDTLSRVPIYVYKNGTLLNWSDILAEGITLKSPITKPSGAIDLILFTSNGQWLAGTTNVAGTYVFEFLKNNVVVASFRFMVLMKAYKSTIVTAYKSSSELPSKPQGASYDFSTTPGTLTMGDDGWVTSPTGLSGTIWFCTGYVSEGVPSSIDWNEPCIYLTEEIVMQEADHRVKEIAIYKAEKTGTSATTPTGGSYSFSANSGEGSFTCPTGWSLEPNAAVAAYKADSNVASTDKDNYKIWKSYNSYQCTVTGDTTLTYGTVTESGWTSPVIYLDIDGILNDADTRAQATFDAALSDASGDLLQAAQLIQNTQPLIDAVNAIFAWRIVGDGSDPLDSKYTELEDTSGVDTTMDGLHALFDGYYSSSNNRYEGTIAALNANTNICISAMEFKAIKFGSVTDLNATETVTNKWVAYIPTTTEIRTQIASLSDDLSQLNTTVNQQTPEWIRLQASTGFLDNVTWTMVPEAEYTSATNKIDLGSAALPTTEYVASTNTSGYRYGYYYKRTASGVTYWYRCDYPISTGFANILADRVSFGVTNNLSGSDARKGSLISMTVDGVEITGQKIVLNGDTIADAIAGKSLNINNRSYINSDGSVYFGMPSGVNLNELSSAARESFLSSSASAPVSSRFNANGSGQLCGGNINWTSNGSLYVKSAYIGNNNEWAIKSTDTTPAVPIIYSKDSSTDQELYISPQYLKSIAAPSTEVPNPNPDWEIHRDGSATFAHGKAVFNAGGSFHIGGASDEVYNVLVTENGQTVTRQEHAGYIDYVPGTGLLTISGDRVNIASNVMALITAGVAGTNEFASIVADAASSSVSINGMLATQDIDVGGGSSYFSTGHDTKAYHGHTYNSTTSGAGHLANGNIWWDNEGNLSIGGQLRLKGTSLEWGGAVQQYDLNLLSFDSTYGDISKQGKFCEKGAIYSLPDPKDYEGREVFVEIYTSKGDMYDILNDNSCLYPNNNTLGQYMLKMPCFEIDSDNWKHRWIKWGVDACKYNTCDINHLPKFYLLGSPFMYKNGTERNANETSGLALYHRITVDNDGVSRANMANDLLNVFVSGMNANVLNAALSDSGDYRYGRKGGLYLIPTAHKCEQLWNCKTSDNDSKYSDRIILRMRCQAKKVRNTGSNDDAWYYWEIQTTDFMPFFDNIEFSPDSGDYLEGDYIDGIRTYDLTASSFYDVYEQALASSLLAFDDGFSVPAVNNSIWNNSNV